MAGREDMLCVDRILRDSAVKHLIEEAEFVGSVILLENVPSGELTLSVICAIIRSETPSKILEASRIVPTRAAETPATFV